jgi:serine-type D-Ala-D-Ala carboxypeptidase/endopeptidase
MRRARSLLPALLAAAVLSAGAAATACAQTPAPAGAATQARHFPSDEELQVMLDYLVADGETPGIVMGIIEADGSTRILQAGSAGPGARPLGPGTVFEIGSINKTFTGTILADMVHKGEVKLDDPVQKYLPANVRVPSRNGRQITLLDLATHRSGLPRLPDNFAPADRTNPYADYTVEQLYAFLNGYQLTRDVGAQFEYSNLGVGLLGHVLGRAAGTNIQTLIRRRILEPLGMRMTSYARDGEIGEWMAKGHDDRGNVVPYWDLTDAIAGAGGLRSSMEDMLRYLQAQLGPPDTELERAMRVAQQVHHRFDDGQTSGLTWGIAMPEGRTLLAHSGGTAGFNTNIAFDPERRIGVVTLTNSGGFGDDLGQDLLLRGPPLAIPEVQVARSVLARYAGEYEMAPGQSAYVRLEDDGTMTLRVPRNMRFRMYAESDSTFFTRRAPWRMRFTRDASGAVSGVVMNMNGTDRTLRRLSDRTTAPAAAPVRDLPLSAEEMARYEGTYTASVGERTIDLRIFAQEGRLMSQATGQPAFRLRSQGDHVFIPDFDDEVRLVFAVENGRATSTTLYQGGAVITATRTQ